MTALAIIAAAGLLSYAMRASFIAFAGERTLPTAIEARLTHARPAVLAAIIGTALVGSAGGAPQLATGPEVPAALVAALVAWRTRDLLWTLAAGVGVMAVFTLIAAA